MYYPRGWRQLLSLAPFVIHYRAQAQFLIENLSFGKSTPISSNGKDILGWHVASEGHTPQILSDRITLTPPAPGYARGAVWSENAVNYAEWTVNMDFRASGPERASGNLQIWFTRDQSPSVGLKSAYTVDTFDGLVLVLDQYAGSGGALRGFLNDGTVNFRNHHNVDSLAFGHCDFVYRNLGRMSKLRMTQAADGLEVTVDDRPCFKSNLVKLPSGYYFGLSAASAEMPDSFEISKFLVEVNLGKHEPGEYNRFQQQPPPPPPPPAAPPSFGTSQQFTGQPPNLQLDQVLTRFNELQQTVTNVNRELNALSHLQMERHQELSRNMPHVQQGQIDAIDRRIQSIETTVQRIQRDIEGRDYQASLTNLQNALRETQSNLMSGLPQSMSQIVTSSAPKMGFFIFVVLAFQLVLAGLYVLYKKRLGNSPKKLL